MFSEEGQAHGNCNVQQNLKLIDVQGNSNKKKIKCMNNNVNNHQKIFFNGYFYGIVIRVFFSSCKLHSLKSSSLVPSPIIFASVVHLGIPNPPIPSESINYSIIYFIYSNSPFYSIGFLSCTLIINACNLTPSKFFV